MIIFVYSAITLLLVIDLKNKQRILLKVQHKVERFVTIVKHTFSHPFS